MGYAYALGMIDAIIDDPLVSKINFGKLLIFAPENPKGGSPISQDKQFKEIWHYGSNLGMSGQDPICQQDGVAPQTDIVGLAENRYGIPNDCDGCQKGFTDSHYIGYFRWVFTKILSTDPKGYIKPRK